MFGVFERKKKSQMKKSGEWGYVWINLFIADFGIFSGRFDGVTRGDSFFFLKDLENIDETVKEILEFLSWWIF